MVAIRMQRYPSSSDAFSPTSCPKAPIASAITACSPTPIAPPTSSGHATAISCLGASRTPPDGVCNHVRRAGRPRNLHKSGSSHSDETFVGRIERGFDFLGYHFRPGELSVTYKTIEQFIARAIRLYEQEPGEACASSRFGRYVRRWAGWAEAGLQETLCALASNGHGRHDFALNVGGRPTPTYE